MDEVLGTQVATSAVVGGGSFNRVPSGVGQGTEVSWDEMGQLGLHKALNEYYKLSASQRKMRLCGMRGSGGPPTLLCTLVQRALVPQLPAALSPPALLAAAGWLVYAAGWLLYSTAAVTIPLALWLVFAADGGLALAPEAVTAAASLHPAAGAAAERLQVAVAALPHPSQPAAVGLLLVMLLLLRLAEAAVLRQRHQRWERQQRHVAAADVQARYAGWCLPGSGDAADAAAAAAAAAAAEQHRQHQLLSVLRLEVERVWHSVHDAQLPPEQLHSLSGIADAVGKLCNETGVTLPPGTADGSSGEAARLLLATMHLIKQDVGVA